MRDNYEPGKGLAATPFAELMWVQHLPEDRKKYMSSRRMKGYSQKGGSFLSSLQRMGLVRSFMPRGSYQFYYSLTKAGEEALAALGELEDAPSVT